MGKEKSQPSLPRGAACLLCRKRKLSKVRTIHCVRRMTPETECDAQKPSCTTCARLGHHCEYSDRTTNEALRHYCNSLEEEIRHLRHKLGTVPEEPGIQPAPDLTAEFLQRNGIFQPEVQVSSNLYQEQYASTSAPTRPPVQDGPFPASTSASIEQYSQPLTTYTNEPLTYGSPDQSSSSSMSSSARHYSMPDGTSTLHNRLPLTTVNGAETATPWLESSCRPSAGPERPVLSASSPHVMPLNQSLLSTQSSVDAPLLPSHVVMQELADIYFGTTHIGLPFIHPPRFKSKLYQEFHAKEDLALIFCVMTLASQYSSDPKIKALTGEFSNSAEQLLYALSDFTRDSISVNATFCLRTVQCYLLLALTAFGDGNHERTFLLIGVATRIAFMLGMHRMDEQALLAEEGVPSARANAEFTRFGQRISPAYLRLDPEDLVEREESRRTMWSLFLLDQFESGITGWPMAASEMNIRLSLPCSDDLYETEELKNQKVLRVWPEVESVQTTAFAWSLRMGLILNRISPLVHRPLGSCAGGPRAPPPQGLLSDSEVMALDQSLAWIEAGLTQLSPYLPESKSCRRFFVTDVSRITTLLALQATKCLLHGLRVTPATVEDIPYAQYGLQQIAKATHEISSLTRVLFELDSHESLPPDTLINPFTACLPWIIYVYERPLNGLVNSQGPVLIEERTMSLAARRKVVNETGKLASSFRTMTLESTTRSDRQLMLDALERTAARWEVARKTLDLLKQTGAN